MVSDLIKVFEKFQELHKNAMPEAKAINYIMLAEALIPDSYGKTGAMRDVQRIPTARRIVARELASGKYKTAEDIINLADEAWLDWRKFRN